jgi:hypothetical protein
LVYAPTYDAALEGNTSLNQAVELFRAYATAQLDDYSTPDVGASPSDIGGAGTATAGSNGVAPYAANRAFSVTSGSLTIGSSSGLLTNGTGDPDGDTLVAALAAASANATLTINADGSFTYTPNAGFQGTDTFLYLVSDGNGGTAVGTVTVQVA